MKYSLDNELFDKLNAGEYKYVVDYVNEDDTLGLRFKGSSANIYYRGLNLATIEKDKITSNKEFSKSISGNALELNKENFDIIILRLKQGVDKSFYWKGNYENEFSQLIERENNSAKLGNITDYFILEDEYPIIFNKDDVVRPDLIGVKISRQERFGLEVRKLNPVWFEVKYTDSEYIDNEYSFDPTPGIKKHISDYAKIYSDEGQTVLNEIIEDLRLMFKQKKKLGLLPGLRNDIEDINILTKPKDMKFVLLLIGHNTRSGLFNTGGKDLVTILQEAVNEHPANIIDNVFIAGTSEIGFGLYEDRMINIRDYIAQNQRALL